MMLGLQLKEILERKVQQVILEHKVCRVYKVQKAILEIKACRDRKEIQEYRAQQGRKVYKVLKEIRGIKASRV